MINQIKKYCNSKNLEAKARCSERMRLTILPTKYFASSENKNHRWNRSCTKFVSLARETDVQDGDWSNNTMWRFIDYGFIQHRIRFSHHRCPLCFEQVNFSSVSVIDQSNLSMRAPGWPGGISAVFDWPLRSNAI